MKTAILTAMVWVCSLGLSAQIKNIFDPAKKAELDKYLTQEVYLDIPGFEGTVESSKAIHLINEFYESQKVSSYKSIHKASGRYLIGVLKGGNKSWRIMYILEKNILKEVQIRSND
ncbi:MAG: DUF4783 domain-containing protein [Flavobacteriales bacterium]|jgi:hypothetical protein|nr:DUF4783 domain-containing protein [Flavobacteriales bacterium]